MLSVSQAVDQSPFTLGKFYGNSRSIFADKGLNWTSLRAQSAHSSGSSEGYPSPPMSGSPSDSAAAPREKSTASEYHTISNVSSQDPQRSWSKEARHAHQDTIIPPMMGSVPHPSDSSHLHNPYAYSRSITSVHQTPRHHEHDYKENHSIGSASTLSSSTFPAEAIAPGSDTHGHPASPKAQRKAKGHVASACKPCKRAHLRCDAQRPCTRCRTNNKEHECVDVQHKKRGRPRLQKEDSARFQHLHEMASRRPANIYPSETTRYAGSRHEPPRKHQLRSFDYGSRAASGPAYLNRLITSDAPDLPNLPLQEPIAFLNLDLEFIKVASTFNEAIAARSSIVGRRLSDLVAANEVERVSRLRNGLINEQKRREPNYLPPIFSRTEHAVQRLSFTRDAVDQIQLDIDEFFGFVTPDGHLRPYHVRLGMFKEQSLYFVAIVLLLPRERQLERTPQYSLPQAPAPHPPPGPSYNAVRRRYSDEPTLAKPSHPQSSQISSTTSPTHSSYTPFPYRAEPQGHGSYQIPRSELPPTTQATNSSPYQLPPIRQHADSSSATGAEPAASRDERPHRLTIGGLIDAPDDQSR